MGSMRLRRFGRAQVSALALGIVLAACMGTAGCGSTSAAPDRSAHTAASAPSPRPPVRVRLNGAHDGLTTGHRLLTITGNVTPGARLNVNSHRVRVTPEGRFHQIIRLTPGPNTIDVLATKPSFRDYTQSLNVVYREPKVKLRIMGDIRNGATVEGQDTVTLQGSVTPGAGVRVNGSEATVAGSTWQLGVSVHLGRNTFRVDAAKRGYQASRQAVTLTRHQSQAEYEASAEQVPYNDLTKDSGPYIRKVVSFRGQIFQIQQNGDRGGMILLSVTDDGYGVWTDNVYVTYDGSTPANTNDVVTIYGRVQQEQTYTSQAGYDITVPAVHAKYIDQTG